MNQPTKNPAVIKYNKQKQRTETAIQFLISLSPSRFAPCNDSNPGGLHSILSALHVIDPSPASPLLSALVNFIPSRKVHIQKLFKAFRPLCNLDDEERAVAQSCPLAFCRPVDRRTAGRAQGEQRPTSNVQSAKCSTNPIEAGVDSRRDIVEVGGIVATGKGRKRRSLMKVAEQAPHIEEHLRLHLPDFEEGEEGKEEEGTKLMDMKCAASICPNDILYTYNASTKSVSKELCVAINFEECGIMTTKMPFGNKAEKKKQKKQITPATTATQFTPLLSIAGAIVTRSTPSSTTSFLLPSGSKSSSFLVLKTLSETDAWAATLQETTESIQGEKDKESVQEGLRCYKNEKEAVMKAQALLDSIPGVGVGE